MSKPSHMEMIEKLCEPLEMSQIELRIGHGKQASNGFSLLLYKTARTDTERLNSVCGTRWKPSYEFDEKNNLKCTIYIYDAELKEWIGRENIGTPSQTEKEKGLYSDALKRAGFSWGIGSELYKVPFIWIPWSNWYNNKPSCSNYIKSWSVRGKIGDGIEILDQNQKVVWSNLNKKPPKVKNNDVSPTPPPKTPREKEQEKKDNMTITPKDIETLTKLIAQKGSDVVKVSGYYKKPLANFTQSEYKNAVEKLKAKPDAGGQ